MSELGESLIKGMEEALAFAKGSDNGAVVHIPEEFNVRRIRKKLNMSQNAFADYFGVSVRTVQDWEQGRRVPSGASKNFLFVIDQEPEAVRRALTSAARRK
ncbi:MAG: helix-turn-helix domain-containing protein [Xenococcaceae cyanobacterium]